MNFYEQLKLEDELEDLTLFFQCYFIHITDDDAQYRPHLIKMDENEKDTPLYNVEWNNQDTKDILLYLLDHKGRTLSHIIRYIEETLDYMDYNPNLDHEETMDLLFEEWEYILYNYYEEPRLDYHKNKLKYIQNKIDKSEYREETLNKKQAIKIIENYYLKAKYSPYTEIGKRFINKMYDEL